MQGTEAEPYIRVGSAKSSKPAPAAASVSDKKVKYNVIPAIKCVL